MEEEGETSGVVEAEQVSVMLATPPSLKDQVTELRERFSVILPAAREVGDVF